jgi:hypothetical protein
MVRMIHPACSPGSRIGRTATASRAGRADAARRPEEANKLLEELANMLVDMRRELMGSGRQR